MSTINHHYQIYFGWSKIRVLFLFKFNVFKHIPKDTVVYDYVIFPEHFHLVFLPYLLHLIGIY